MIATPSIVDVREGEGLNLVMLGPPGVGKGTQAERLTRALRIPHISTGDLFRGMMATDSVMGARLRGFVDRGEYVPDAVVIEIVQAELSQGNAARGFILDGFPRTVAQAEALDRLLAHSGRSLDAALDITAPVEVLAQRMAHRSALEHRSDDNPQVFLTRLKRYTDQTQPVLDYYAPQGKLVVVDGAGSVEDVSVAVDTALRARAPQYGSR